VTAAAEFAERVRGVLVSRDPVPVNDATLAPASVLLPFFAGENGAPMLWLVRRADGMRIHGGQVALPGGKREPDDVNPLATALREAHEEIGLPPGDVDVLGVLDDYVTITGFAVTPFVGWLAKPFEPLPLAAEVARVFAAPFAAFEQPARAITLEWGGAKRIVLSYDAAGETVWGATASILRGFVDLIRDGRTFSDRAQ
jgi:8-oxo-dGTP pyrophosphatase MutT (NUDIX family)